MLHETQEGIYLDNEQDIKNDIRAIVQNLKLEDVKELKEDYVAYGKIFIFENDFLREPLDNSNVYFGITTTIWNENIPYDRDDEVESESLLEYIQKDEDMLEFLKSTIKDRFWEVAI